MVKLVLWPKWVHLWVCFVQEDTVDTTLRSVGGGYRNFFLATERWICSVPMVVIWSWGAIWGSRFLIGRVWGKLVPWVYKPRMLWMDMILGTYAVIVLWKLGKKVLHDHVLVLDGFWVVHNFVVWHWCAYHWIRLEERIPTVYGFVHIGYIGEDVWFFV